ncbi:MAG: heterodisulfide reductase-related iron-sulfur binding cluster [Leptonema sp. (in: bacteria)]
MKIEQTNTENAIYDPKNPLYWEVESLEKEWNRTFDICNGCRMCFHYCGSFSKLFQSLDTYAEGDVLKITKEDKEKIVELCYHCKLCYINCPYTDKDKHIFNLNFAALMQRSVHVQSKKKGVPLRDKILQNSDLAGKLNSNILSTFVNYTMKNEFHRSIIEKILKIHKKKLMPEFHRTPFAKWFKKHKKIENPKFHVVLFSTCFVNYNNPQIGKDAVFVLEKNQCNVEHPKQNCCGMPGINTGDLDFALKKIKKNIESLYPYAEKNLKILVINPTCSMTLRKEYPLYAGLLGKTNEEKKEWEEKAKRISDQCMDITEFLMHLNKQESFSKDFKTTPISIGYHAACHLRAQWKGFPSRDLLKSIPNTQVSFVAECCGHNGTWSMKKENFELSLEYGKKAFSNLKSKEANWISTDCPLAALQLKQGMNLKEIPLHPIQILAKAYRKKEEGGFPDPIEK